jgi:hypothetical protein
MQVTKLVLRLESPQKGCRTREIREKSAHLTRDFVYIHELVAVTWVVHFRQSD